MKDRQLQWAGQRNRRVAERIELVTTSEEMLSDLGSAKDDMVDSVIQLRQSGKQLVQ